MVDLIFQSGMRGVVWKTYEDEIRKEFCSYNVKKVAKFNDKDVERMLSNPKMFKHRKKIKACIHNAKEITKLSEQFGGFSNFIGNNKVPDLIEELKERMKWMDEINARAFLRYTGCGVMKPDLNVRRVMYRLGLIYSDSATLKTYEQVQEVGEKMAKAVGEKVAVIDYTLYMFGSGEFLRHSVCGVKPRCEECVLRKFCRYAKKV